MTKIQAILFDKDGCLCDFSGTWDGWAAGLMERLSGGDPARKAALAEALAFDLDTARFRPESAVIAGTHRETAELVAQALRRDDLDAVETWLMREAETVDLVEVIPLAPFLRGLAARGLLLAVATNDGEALARAQLEAVGAAPYFGAIIGADSGFGGKPQAGPLLACADALGVAPEACVMVGDSRTDLMAARAAGMRGIGVLTGLAVTAELAPLAEVVLPDISHLPGWLDAPGG